MHRLALGIALASFGCQRHEPNTHATPTVLEAIVPVPSGDSVQQVVDSPISKKTAVLSPANRVDRVTFVSSERLNGSEPLTTAEVQYLLGSCMEAGDVERVVAAGTRLFPAFEVLLNDSSTSEDDQRAVLGLVGGMPGDRSRFMDHALTRLKSKNGNLRRAAVGFMGRAGTERDAALITVMLLDKDSTVQHAAGDALAKIGGEREVAVFDLIIHNATRYEEDKLLILNQHMLDVYAECRDKIKARLKEANDKKPTAPPPEKK